MAVIISNKKATMSLNLVLLFCLFLIISFAEGKQPGIGFGGVKATPRAPRAPRCQKVYGAKVGDTCNGIIQKFKLDAVHFFEINPNVNRDSIFVGQWLCIVGTTK